MVLPHSNKSYCGCSLKMNAITIGIIYLMICFFAVLLTLLAGVTGITIRMLTNAENAKLRNSGRFLTPAPAPTEPSNEIDISQEFATQNEPDVGEDHPGKEAFEEVLKHFRPTSLPELDGIRIKTKKPETISLDDTWMEQGLNNSYDATPDEEEDEAKLKVLIMVTMSALTFILISAFFDILLIHGAMRDRPTCVYSWMIEQTILLFLEVVLLASMLLYGGFTLGPIIVLLEIASRFYCLLIGNNLYQFLRHRQTSRGFTGRIIVRIVQ